jgi:thymidylate synthase
MYLAARTLDDLMLRVLEKLLVSPVRVGSSQGDNTEISGILLKLSNPRARLSRAEGRGVLPSALGEFLWYMSGRNDLQFIEYFIPQYSRFAESDGTVWGAYGPRLMSWKGLCQIENIVSMMISHPETRQAVIQIFDAADVAEEHNDTPCTCVLQFLARGGRLNLMVTMRSNDAYIGFPHDIFAFTMIQELVARRLRMRLGWYKHAVGSMHLYDRDRQRAENYVSERWQPSRGVAMPAMPASDPTHAIQRLLSVEGSLREHAGQGSEQVIAALPAYWRDLAEVLRAYAMQVSGRAVDEIAALRDRLSFPVYATYIDGIARRASFAATSGARQ